MTIEDINILNTADEVQTMDLNRTTGEFKAIIRLVYEMAKLKLVCSVICYVSSTNEHLLDNFDRKNESNSDEKRLQFI